MNIVNILKEQYSNDFSKSSTSDFNKTVEVMIALLNLKTGNNDLNGVNETVITSLEKAFSTETPCPVDALKILSTELEVYLKKLIFVSDGTLHKVEKQADGNIYLPQLLRYLRIDNFEFTKPVYQYTRNHQTHNSPKLPYHLYYTELKNIILTYLMATSKRMSQLNSVLFPDTDFTTYLKEVVQEYNDRKAAFVDLEVKEYIEIFGKEVITRSDNTQKARVDTIVNLRKKISENQMMILGLAGMGKTTSLLYLAAQDAKALQEKKEVTLPVYITLAAFTDKEDSIIGKISQKINRSREFTESLLKKGKITLFLDGFNEVLEFYIEMTKRKIQAFIDSFPNTKIIIASRPVAYEEIEFKEAGQTLTENRKPIPAFLLLEMKENLVEDFIKRNYTGDSTELYSFLKKKENESLLSMLKNPLYLAEFIKTYQPDAQLPASTTILTGRFLNLKYDREKKQNAEFNKIGFHSTMVKYTIEISLSEEYGMQNPQIPEATAQKYLTPILEKISMNAETFLRHAISLNILLNHTKDNAYSFAHQSYQDFYMDEEA